MNGNYHHIRKKEYQKYAPSGYVPWDNKKPKQTEKPIEITNPNKFIVVEPNEDSDETLENNCLGLWFNEIKK